MDKNAEGTLKERLSALQAEQRRTERRRRVVMISATVVVAAGVATAATAFVLADRAGRSLDAVQTINVTGRNHTDKVVSYPQAPPVGGDHAPEWQNCGIYPKPLRNENVVHSQEHGAVWIAFQPGLPKDQLDILYKQAQGRDFVVLSPYTGLSAPVVLSAWGKQLKLDNADDPRLTAFLRANINGPGTPEPGASCSGGVGEPSA
ncbi:MULTISPECIES: DUF3105 domain-containing protein [unclassified Nonomuraea]|uniref:DUF3105 domain-containing protein n=1 Tax=unclassified Nonomuraea TaxID=2593643 RepID=UPI0033FD9547